MYFLSVNKLLLISFLLAFLLFFPAIGNAQLRVGPKIGLQLARTVFAEEAYRSQFSSGYKPGIQLGAVVNYRVSPVFSLHTELYYNLKGKKTQSLSTTRDIIKNSAYYHYIDLPVLLRISTHKSLRKSKLEFYVNAGPNINYWLGGWGKLVNPEMLEFYATDQLPYKIRFTEPEALNPRELYVRDANRIQMSLDFGAGIIFDLGMGQSIMIDVRNSLGLGRTYMGKRDSGDFGLYNYQDNFEAVNHVFSISGAWLIDIDMQALLQKGRIRR